MMNSTPSHLFYDDKFFENGSTVVGMRGGGGEGRRDWERFPKSPSQDPSKRKGKCARLMSRWWFGELVKVMG